MTVSTSKRVKRHVGNGVTTQFPYDFYIPNEASLEVYLYDSVTGVNQLLSPSVYSVTGIGDHNFGEVTYPLSGSPITSNQILTIRRVVEYTQNTSIRNQTGFFPEVIEDALDHLTFQTQQNAEDLSRAIVAPLEEESDMTLPSKTKRASKVLGFDSDGLPVALSQLDKSADTVTALGSNTPRTLAEHLATLPDAKITATGTSTPRSLAERFSDMAISLLDEGGVADGSLTDGSGTSNSAALQACFNLAESRGASTGEGIPVIDIPPGVWLIDEAVVATKRVKLRGCGKYQSLLLIRLSSRDGSTPGIDFQNGAVLEGVGFRGYVSGDTNWFLADSVGINAGNAIDADNCDFFGFEKCITWSGGYYSKFNQCVFQRSKTVFSGWNANNVSFFGCRVAIIDTFFEYNAGAGPVSAYGCSFESWTGFIFRGVSGARAQISLFGNYFENYPANDAGRGLPDAKFDSGIIIAGVGSATLLGNMISLKGILRVIDASGSTLNVLISKGNRLIAFDSSPNDTADYIFRAASYNTVDCQDYFDGTFAGTAYISGTYTYPQAVRIINPATFADDSPAIPWTAPTLLNGWVNDGGDGYENAGYRLVGKEVQLRGQVDGGAATDLVIMTLPSGYRPSGYRVLPATTLGGSPTHVNIRISPNGDVRVENTTYTINNLSLDNIRFYL